MAHNDIARLPDINARIRRTAHKYRVNQDIFAFDGIDPICAIGGQWSARPFNAQFVIDDAVRTL